MDAVAGFHALHQGGAVRCLIDHVHTGLIHRDRIKARSDPDVMHIGLCRIAVAVAVHRQPVHDIDVDDVVCPDMVAHCADHLRQGLQPGVLVVIPDAAAGLCARRVDQDLAGRGGHTDRDVLDGAAKARHGMALEMGQDHPVRIVFSMTAEDGPVQSGPAGHGPFHLALFVQEVEVRDGRKAVVLGDLFMHGSRSAGAPVGRIALDDGPIHLFHQVFDQLRAQIVAGRRLAGGDLHGRLSGRRPAQPVIDADQALRGDIRCEIHDRIAVGCRCGCRSCRS